MGKEILDYKTPWTVEELLDVALRGDGYTIKTRWAEAESKPDGFLYGSEKSQYYVPSTPTGKCGSAWEGERLFRLRMTTDHTPGKPDPKKSLIDLYVLLCEDLGIDISGGAAETKPKKTASKSSKETDVEEEDEPKKSSVKAPKPGSRRSLRGKEVDPDADADDSDDAEEEAPKKPATRVSKASKAEKEDEENDSGVTDFRSFLDAQQKMIAESEGRILKEIHGVNAGINKSTDTIVSHVTAEHDKTREEVDLNAKRVALVVSRLTGRLFTPEDAFEDLQVLKASRKIVNKAIDEFDPKDSPLYGK